MECYGIKSALHYCTLQINLFLLTYILITSDANDEKFLVNQQSNY